MLVSYGMGVTYLFVWDFDLLATEISYISPMLFFVTFFE